MENQRKFVRVRDVDRQKLSELIVKAKGPRRSIRVFAEELGVNPSTLTRIINMQNKSYSRDSLIISIAEHADPDSNVTLEMLMDAHGVQEETAESTNGYNASFEKRMRQVIFEELITRGYSIQNVSLGESVGKSRYDMVVETDALGEVSKWAFEFKAVTLNFTGLGNIRDWISRIMECFYLNKGEIRRISLVVENREVFEKIKKWLSDYSIPDEFSVLYIGDNQVLEEYIVDKTDGVPVYVFKNDSNNLKEEC